MKIGLLAMLLILAMFILGQISFENGYKAGYAQAELEIEQNVRDYWGKALLKGEL